jgi:hypothetical protein
MERVPFPASGSRRERVTTYLEAEARAFERFVAEAPEQWLAVFHPIWPDLERAPAARPSARVAGKATASADEPAEGLARGAAR